MILEFSNEVLNEASNFEGLEVEDRRLDIQQLKIHTAVQAYVRRSSDQAVRSCANPATQD